MNKMYSFAYTILWPIVHILWPYRYTGRAAIPEGAAVVCANHSSFIDPILVALAFGRKHFLHFMAKAELFKVPVLNWVMRKAGAYGVNRGANDISAVRTSMKFLKAGEKILIFPEGTRVSEDDAVEARNGAIRLASKLRVPIVPVHVPRRKKLFSRVYINIGQPYYIENADHSNFDSHSNELMQRIRDLQGENK